MNRRGFLKLAGYSAGASLLAGVGWLTFAPKRVLIPLTAIRVKLEDLERYNFSALGEWTLDEVLIHCAQSIECSMTGYPKHKSDIFKSTIGSVAFESFSKLGSMTHNLNEGIPGLPWPPENLGGKGAVARLQKAINLFLAYEGQLHAHFAYGELDKNSYEVAHVLHILDHLPELGA